MVYWDEAQTDAVCNYWVELSKGKWTEEEKLEKCKYLHAQRLIYPSRVPVSQTKSWASICNAQTPIPHSTRWIGYFGP